MFVAAYDNREKMPRYFTHFIQNTTKFCDLHLIAPVPECPEEVLSSSENSRFKFKLLKPSELQGYDLAKRLFDDVFINYSTNSDTFERTCFHRWFALNAATHDVPDDDYVCLLDTDVLIGMSPSDIFSECAQKDENKDIQFIAEWDDKDPVAVGPEITIMTKAFLFGFCRYLLTTYYSPHMKPQLMEAYFDRIGRGLHGGVCDMRALAAYIKPHSDRIFNLQNMDNPYLISNFNRFFNGTIGRTDDWRISFLPDMQTLQVASETKRLVGVHFQGSAKALMYVAGSSDIITRDICLEYLEKKRSDSQKKIGRVKRIIKRFLKFASK